MNKITFYTGLSILLMSLLFSCEPSNPATQNEAPVDYMNESLEAFDARMQWWREARFGMFIHWGAYAVPAGVYEGEEAPGIGEWIMESANIPIEKYEEFVAAFNPVKYDAKAWARIAKEAGMKYIIITSKHHDGFCLWDSQTSSYDAMEASPIQRDLLAELKAACDEVGIKLGFYHSIMDWHHPDAQAPHYPTYNTREKENPRFQTYVQNYLTPQLKELVEGYDPAVLWFDGEWVPEWTHENGLATYQYVRSLKPDILINNRVDKGRQGMQGMNASDQKYAGDFGTPEQEILAGTSSYDWESCMTMNDTWGFKVNDTNWKTAETLIHNLVDIVAKGGNYLLNVGPTEEGEIPEASVERLAAMGEWIKVNGEAIYGNRLWDHYQEGQNLRFIQSGTDSQTVYIISLVWPGEQLELHSLKPESQAEIRLLGASDEPLFWEYKANEGLKIKLPTPIVTSPASLPVRHAYVFKLTGGCKAADQYPAK